MKNKLIILLILVGISSILQAQTINWRSFSQQNQVVHIKAGWDYGLTYGLGYGYKLDTKMPILMNVEYSPPAGKNLFDDFKTRVGGQMEVLHSGPFSATAKVYCPIRRYENNQVQLMSFGGEFSGVAGIFKPRWFIAAELGFDKAIATHVKHLPAGLEQNPGLQSGWYVPTGGNYFYGVQTGFSFRSNDITAKFGKLTSQGFKTAPFIPLFTGLEYHRRF